MTSLLLNSKVGMENQDSQTDRKLRWKRQALALYVGNVENGIGNFSNLKISIKQTGTDENWMLLKITQSWNDRLQRYNAYCCQNSFDPTPKTIKVTKSKNVFASICWITVHTVCIMNNTRKVIELSRKHQNLKRFQTLKLNFLQFKIISWSVFQSRQRRIHVRCSKNSQSVSRS